MFYYLSGTVGHVEPYLAVIDCGGVGYACRTTTYTLSTLKKGRRPNSIPTSTSGRMPWNLYGFSTQEERNLFELLISVSGVGPKAGPQHPLCLRPGEPGLEHHHRGREGPDLRPGHRQKDRPAGDPGTQGQTGQGPGGVQRRRHGGAPVAVIPDNKLSEAGAALAVLGYSQGEINVALKGADLEKPLEEVIRQALKKMVKA